MTPSVLFAAFVQRFLERFGAPPKDHDVKIETRTPAGSRGFRLSHGEWTLLRTTNGMWRVGRTRRGAWWAISTRRSLIATAAGAWKNRGYYPHPLYRR